MNKSRFLTAASVFGFALVISLPANAQSTPAAQQDAAAEEESD